MIEIVNHMSIEPMVYVSGINFLFCVGMSGLTMIMLGNIYLNIKLGGGVRDGEGRGRE